MSSFEEAKRFLKKSGYDGTSLYDHLAEVIVKIVSEKIPNANENFENISSHVRKSKQLQNEASLGESYALLKSKQMEWISAKKLDSSKTSSAEEDEETETNTADLGEELHLWNWAGVGFGSLETYRISQSMKTLSRSLPPARGTLQLWGKVLSQSGEYIIVRGKSLESEGEEDDRNSEGIAGPNKHTYWVTSDFDRNWSMLPQVKPAEIVCARRIRRIFTGNLEASVPGHPPFPGLEKNLLRAQESGCIIARITAGANVSPQGFFEVDEDSIIKEVENETLYEKFPKPIEELNDLNKWIHYELELNDLGRTGPEPMDGNEGNDSKIERNVNVVPPLRSIDEDEKGSWRLKIAPGSGGKKDDQVVVATSLVWPGAYSIAKGRKFINLYVGNALKYINHQFEFSLPPSMQQNWLPSNYLEDLEEYKRKQQELEVARSTSEMEKNVNEELDERSNNERDGSADAAEEAAAAIENTNSRGEKEAEVEEPPFPGLLEQSDLLNNPNPPDQPKKDDEEEDKEEEEDED